MKKIILLVLAALSLPVLAQSNSVYNATTYAYTTQITSGNTSTGSSSVRANPTAFAQGIPFLPYNLNAPITLNRNAATAETLTPSAVANCYPNSLTCTLSGTFTFKHISGESIQSGTFGLQEALNVAVAAGSGTVLIDASWQGPTGASLITAAKGNGNILIQDNRNPSGATFYQWNGSAYVAAGGSGAVSSVFSRAGAVTAQTGDYTCAQVTGCNSASSGITSINGDTTTAQQMQASGTGLSVATVAGVTTYTLAGGGITGTVNTGAANQAGCYPSAGTVIGPCPNIYALNPAMTATQIGTLLGGLGGSNVYIIPPGTPQVTYNYNSQVPLDLRMGANYFQMPGVACDAKQSALTITITSGSNTSNVGALLTTADIGKTFFFTTRSGYAFGFTQSVWAATLNGYTFPTATWSTTAPFSQTGQVWYGTDSLSNVNTAMTQANAVFPLTIPTNCQILVNGTIPWNNNQVIVGRHLNHGGFVGRPGLDVIATTDTNGNSVSAPGTGMKGFETVVGSEIDATYGWNYYSANGTLTVIPALYRPAQTHTPNANHPCAPGWFIGCINGVGSITAASVAMTVPAGVSLPVVGNTIVFPYLTKVFTTAVDAVNVGTRVVTLHVAAPAASTGAQQEWFAGTSVQTTTTTIPGTPSYPFTLQLSNSLAFIPGWVSNVAQWGHAKIQDYEFDYMGIDPIANTIVVRRGPASVNGGAGYAGTNTIVPLNPCPAKFTQPWPVTPSINAGDSTPSGANWFPGQCVGNAGIAFPTANGNVYVGAGLVSGFLKDLQFIPSSIQSTNSIAKIYVAGNNAPFSSTFENLTGQGFQYGYVQGPASSGQHGVASVGPTGIGNTFSHIFFFDAFPLSFSDMQGSVVDELNMNSTMISPYDGTAIGSATCLQEGYTLDEQTGGIVTSTQFNTHHAYACEPENGSHIVVPASVIIDSTHASFDAANFEGVLNIFSGDHLKITNSQLSFPTINYGTDNDFGIVSGQSAFYSTNVWNAHAEFYNWGINSTCAMYTGTLGGPAVPCGPGLVQGAHGRSINSSVTLTKEENWESGKITPGEWNTNGGLDSAPMQVNNAVDPSEPFWGRYAGCNLNAGGAQCHPQSFDGLNGFIYIGTHQRIADQPYVAQFDLKSATAGGQVTVQLSAFDSGTGQCSATGTIASGTYTTTTSWNDLNHPFTLPADFTGHSGCILQIQFFNATTTDQYRVGYFNFVPAPLGVQGPIVAPTEGSTCPRSNNWLGSVGGFAYFCDAGVVKRTAIT